MQHESSSQGKLLREITNADVINICVCVCVCVCVFVNAVVNTAWATLALMAAKCPKIDAIERGIQVGLSTSFLCVFVSRGLIHYN